MSATPEGINADVCCPKCGYNLRGLLVHRCPECGEAFDPNQLTDSQLPWSHRKRIGRMRAYWQTVRLVMFNRRAFWEEMNRRVSYSDAQSFRWITIVIAQLPFLMISFSDMPLVAGDIWTTLGLQVSIFLTFAVLTGLPSYFFHPGDISILRQNRAVALSYYGCAPLAWSPAVWFLSLVVSKGNSTGLLVGFVVSASVAPFALWWQYLLQLARHGMHRERVWLIAIAIPTLWLILGGLTLIGVNAIVQFLGVAHYSVQD